MLDQFGTIRIRNYQLGFCNLIAVSMDWARNSSFQERPVYFSHLFDGTLSFHSNHDSIRMKEIGDRRSFPQKLRIGNYVTFQMVGIVKGKMSAQLPTRLHWNCALLNDQAGSVRTLRNRERYCFNGRKISLSIFLGWSSHADE